MSKHPLRFKKINVVAYSDIDSDNQNCVCTRPLMAPTMNELAACKVTGNIYIGDCKHGFHAQCINDCIKDNGGVCPMCKTTWKTNRIVDSRIPVKSFKPTVEKPDEKSDIKSPTTKESVTVEEVD